jgi:hypothetical protein
LRRTRRLTPTTRRKFAGLSLAGSEFGGGRHTAGPPHIRYFIPYLTVIPAQKSRDLLYREPAPQLGQLRIRPFSSGVHGWRFILNLGPLWIDDRGTDHPEKRISLGTLRPAEKIVDFYVAHPAA